MDTVVTLSVTLDRPLYDRLCALAAASGRSTSWLIDQALRSYIDRHEPDIDAGPAPPARPDASEARRTPSAPARRGR